MSVVLNGRTYQNSDFVGFGYATLFPNPAFDDLIAELSTRDAAITAAISAQNSAITATINNLSIVGFASTTSLAIGTGAKNFTLTQAASAAAGVYKVASAASPANFMIVRLSAATSSSTTFNTTSSIAVGSGTFADWTIVSLDDTQRRGYRSIAAADTVTTSDLNAIIECTVGGYTVAADPVATLRAGFAVTLINSSAADVTFNPSGAELVNGASTLVIPAGRAVTLVVTGSAWYAADRQILSHDIVTGHTASGLTAGHYLRATGATTFAFGAVQSTDLPAATRRAERFARLALWERTKPALRRWSRG